MGQCNPESMEVSSPQPSRSSDRKARPAGFVRCAGYALLVAAAAPMALAAAAPTTTVSLNTLFFDFGNNLVGNKLIQTAVVITNTGANPLMMSPALSGDPSYSIATRGSCGATLAPGASCDIIMRYQPTTASYPKSQDASLAMNFANAAQGTPDTVSITGVSGTIKAGVVTSTINPQVALYTMTLPFPGRMKVEFGETTAYGHRTSFSTTEENNGTVSVFVAGMKGSTTYHMAGWVELSNGIIATDTDHSFTTGAVPAAMNFKVTATTAEGMTPQPGVEFTNPLNGLVVYDLDGNPIWTYVVPNFGKNDLDGAKQLPNGDFLVAIGPLPPTPPFTQPVQPGAITELREINLAGETVREISIADLNAALSTATCRECANLAVLSFHHDVTPLPNGHWLALTNVIENLSPTSTPALTNLPAQNVLGDVIIDLDENMHPVWVWNEFNHLDPNRHPYLFPDWTHTNAVLYSPDDGNILVSMRHQNWIVKVKYRDGHGDGDILWHFGQGSDFKLVGGTDPIDWPYAQHDPGFFSANTSGVFSLGAMDNGDDRLYPAGNKCTPQANLPASCLYTSVPIYRIDEKAMTATITFHQKMPGSEYSFFGGNVDALDNGDVEYDLCGLNLPGAGSTVREVTQDASATTVWTMNVTGGYFYRAFRIPSLYPRITW